MPPGGGGALTRDLIGLHLVGRLGDDDPLQGQLVDQLLRGARGHHRRQLAGASTDIGHRRHLVGCGLMGGELGIRDIEGFKIGALAVLCSGLNSQFVVGIALRGGDGFPGLQRLLGQLIELGQRVSRRVRVDVARYRR